MERRLWEREKKKFGVPAAPEWFYTLPQGHEDSEYVLSFEIGQRESVFCSGRRQTDKATKYGISV